MSRPGNVGFSGHLQMRHTGVRCVTRRWVAAILFVLAVTAPVVQAYVAAGVAVGIAVNLIAFAGGFFAIKRATFAEVYEA